VLSTNTNFLSTHYRNACGSPADGDPGKATLAWLEAELAAAKEARERVWLVYHIPPGIDGFATLRRGACPSLMIPMWDQTYAAAFLTLLKRYADTVAVSFAGHTHMDDFRLIGDAEGRYGFALITPAVSPIFGQNPAFRTVTYDAAGGILDQTTYDLTNFPQATTAAEESTAWPQVSRPVEYGGLGFGYKWNMGWMHDTLGYIGKDPIHRKYHHGDILFGLHYAFSENFILPLSHDEVVHGKRSILGRMPGDDWQRFANLRAYYSFMFGHPGKKLMFMGCEFGQEREWDHDHSLDWHLTAQPKHAGIQSLVRDLNRLYRALPALHELDCDPAGFEWVITDDTGNNVFAWIRKGSDPRARCLVVANFSPNVYRNYRLRVPLAGKWHEVFNSDSAHYGGTNVGNIGEVRASGGATPELSLTIPPLAAIFLVPES